MKRYHKAVNFPETDKNKLQLLNDKLNSLSWSYTSHCLDNLKYRVINIKELLIYINSLTLTIDNIFEYYINNDDIIKVCYRIQYTKDIDIILVVNQDKKIITIYLNNTTDNHVTLKRYMYTKQ